ncbi:MAG: lipoyl(octanoyl) transferase LipB [Xanthomonadales bacterium]|nr:lipoyl(octanoyl) transferase LipB [Xanthomonadales bacterium]
MDALAPGNPLIVRKLGRRDYEPVWRAMQHYTDARDATSADELWLLEHPPVFTLGQAARMEHVLAPGDIPVVQVDRGGQVTYHGPGQVVLYPLLDLRRSGLGIRGLVELLEQAVIEVLEGYGVSSQRRDGAPGVYAGDAKVAALGLRVRRGCTFHGLAFNVAMDLEPFSRINPCGFRDLAVTQVSDLCGIDDMGRVGDDLLEQVAWLLERPLRDGAADLPRAGVRSIMEQQ